ncbi:NAD-dependent dehydratase [Microbacterium paludicola]|uniref:NAD-dependent dehydratase n=1 Tax=Microbacterium paludicola TaxID=300019 RepID=A0A4Y9FZ95_9MICO|nr:NAD(P)H-binding protein [Microbacterium paludicola]MBF0815026.1 NAD(P)H-binding protein [Microbacterium paludicola]TFU34304.1 NAD-dependent dehydratase [Microbacterium paludicola]
MADVVIIGGHGKVALLVLPLLAEAGHSATAVIRNPAHAADVEAAAGTPLVLDVENATEDELAAAFTGRDAIVWSAGAGGGDTRRTYAVDRDAAIRSMDAAARAGVRRYVMVSYLGAGPDHGVPEDNSFHAYAEAKAAADAHLRASGLDWTVLGPAGLTLEEPTGLIDVAPLPEDAERRVSRANVARTIVAALELDATIGRTIEYVDGATPIREALARV